MKLHDELESPVLKQLNNIWLDGIFRCKRCATLMKEPSTSSWSTTKVCMNLRWCMFWHKVLQEEHMGGDSKIVPKWLQVGQMYLEKRSIFHNFTVRLHKFFLLGGYYFLDKPLHIYFPKRRWKIFGNVEFLGVAKLCCPDGAEMAEVVPAGLWIATFGAPRWSSTSCFGQHGIGEGHQIGIDLDIGIESLNIKVCSWQYDNAAIFCSEGVGRHPELPPSAPMQVFKRLNLVGRFGVTTGRSYCGVGGLSVKGTGGT